MKLKFLISRKILLTLSITGLVIAVGFGAFFFLSGWNDRLEGSIQLFPEPAKPYTMPTFSSVDDLLRTAGISLFDDQLLFINGNLSESKAILPQNAVIEVRTLHSIWIEMDGVRQPFQTFEPTVERVLREANLQTSEQDRLHPDRDAFVTNGMLIQIQTAKPITIQVNGQNISFLSPERLPAAILADFGFTPMGADVTTTERMDDGTTLIRVETGFETIQFEASYNSYTTIQKYAADLPRGETRIEQTGSPGITLKTSRKLMYQTKERQLIIGPKVVTEPVDQIELTSNQTGVFSLETDLGDLQYWKVLEMYTTSYSPCNSGVNRCLTGTSSGLPAGYGVVAVTPSVFNALNGTQVYIPGYGIGVIGDVGGGFPDGRPWIDLGFDDSNYTGWYGYHTVYFLGPPPAYDPF